MDFESHFNSVSRKAGVAFWLILVFNILFGLGILSALGLGIYWLFGKVL